MQYIGLSFVYEGVILPEAKSRAISQNEVLYAACRPNCYAIHDILSTNDGILVNVCHFVFYAHAHYLILAKHMLRQAVASWVAMVSLESLPIAFENRLLTCFS